MDNKNVWLPLVYDCEAAFSEALSLWTDIITKQNIGCPSTAAFKHNNH